jgi:hypothetical protein
MPNLNDDARPVNGSPFKNPKSKRSAADIKAALRGREHDVLRRLGINWPPKAGDHILCPFPGHDDKTPSWRWVDAKSRWYCTCGFGSGDIIDAVKIQGNLSPSAALIYLRDLCAGTAPNIAYREKIKSPEVDAKAKRNRGIARYLWRNAQPIQGTAAEEYLTETRGIPFDACIHPQSLKFDSNHALYVNGVKVGCHPALVAGLSRASGTEIEAISRVYLRELLAAIMVLPIGAVCISWLT